ncbi:MAG: RDD family protein [Victivallales bacterium]|nr:RDD family protein [Victivallales bacterium]
MAIENQYLYQIGNEPAQGPFDEKSIIALAQSGKIPYDAKIRSTLLPIWTKARDVDFLKDIYRDILLKMAEAHSLSDKAKRNARMNLRGDFDPMATALSQEGITYEATTPIARTLVAMTDLLLEAAGALAIMFVCWILVCFHILPSSIATYVFLAVVWIGLGIYHVWMLNVYGQTLGMRFWGLVAITADKRPVYCFRAYGYFLLVCLFGVFTPFTWLLTGGRFSLQEYLADLRIRRIHIARQNY